MVWNDDFTVKHVLSNTCVDRDAMIQSKYIQSDMNSCYKDVKKKLEEGRTVLFTGTPCQCAALKIFLRNTKIDNLILCDVLCGGNVSPGFFKSYINYIENVKTIRHRRSVSEQKNGLETTSYTGDFKSFNLRRSKKR